MAKGKSRTAKPGSRVSKEKEPLPVQQIRPLEEIASGPLKGLTLSEQQELAVIGYRSGLDIPYLRKFSNLIDVLIRREEYTLARSVAWEHVAAAEHALRTVSKEDPNLIYKIAWKGFEFYQAFVSVCETSKEWNEGRTGFFDKPISIKFLYNSDKENLDISRLLEGETDLWNDRSILTNLDRRVSERDVALGVARMHLAKDNANAAYDYFMGVVPELDSRTEYRDAKQNKRNLPRLEIYSNILQEYTKILNNVKSEMPLNFIKEITKRVREKISPMLRDGYAEAENIMLLSMRDQAQRFKAYQYMILFGADGPSQKDDIEHFMMLARCLTDHDLDGLREKDFELGTELMKERDPEKLDEYNGIRYRLDKEYSGFRKKISVFVPSLRPAYMKS